MKRVFAFVFVLCLIFPMVSAGVGLSWDQESAMVAEKTKTCLTYKVYNPWPEDVYTQIQLSEELTEILRSADSETKFIPKDTSSGQAIPITFCFKTPSVYQEDCLIGKSLLCKQECTEEMKTYSGEVQVIELTEAEANGNTGSKTQMSDCALLRMK